MDKERLIKSLNIASNKGVALGIFDPIYNPKSYIAYEFSRYWVRTKSEVVDSIVEVLKRDDDLVVFDGGFLNTGIGGGRVELRDLAEWLLAGTIALSAEEVVGQLDRFIKMNDSPVLEILTIAGIEVKEEIELFDNIKLVPISKLPRSRATDASQGISQYLPDLFHYPGPVGTAAIVASRKVATKFLTNKPGDSQKKLLQDRTIWDVCKGITLLGPSAPTPLYYWFQLEEWVPLAHKTFSSGVSMHEILPDRAVAIQKNGCKELICKFIAMNQSLKTKLSIPIDRLNLAMKRMNSVDKAIELGIALESLLVSDRDKNAPIAFLLRLRGATLGADTLDERIKIFKTLKNIYELRSQAVHSGVLKEKESSDRILEDGMSICASLIIKIIERGSFPDWDHLILNQGNLDEFTNIC